jgi:hypothetical protein
MALINGSASQVLVLNQVLLRSKLGVLHQEEIMERIAFSGWMDRLWMLREGAMSPYVYFQCEDGAFSPKTQPTTLVRRNPSQYRLASLREYISAFLWFRHAQNCSRFVTALHRLVPEQLIFKPLVQTCNKSIYGMGSKLPTDRGFTTSQHNAEKVGRLIAVWSASPDTSLSNNILTFKLPKPVMHYPQEQRPWKRIYPQSLRI